MIINLSNEKTIKLPELASRTPSSSSESETSDGEEEGGDENTPRDQMMIPQCSVDLGGHCSTIAKLIAMDGPELWNSA